tara:strand:+ start:4268 stop:5629 length:1362 start_codon:yes stop_codon:yes gene_type:complete
MRNLIYCSLSLLILAACGGSQKTADYSFLYEEEDTVLITVADFEEQEAEGVELIYKNHLYQESIHTVLLHPIRFEMGNPVLNLNRADSLILSFDELDEVPKNYYYTLIHCNADWTPSDLLESEYLSGFTEEPIYNYESSFNTIQSYTHYEAIIPGENMQPILSGNYLVIVFEEGEREFPVLSKRMMVLDEKVQIEGSVKRATLLDQRNFQHEVDFKVLHPAYEIDNPFGEIYPVIIQNDRWDNAITGLPPVFVKNNELIYDFEEENLFDGGNEYRFFDSKSLRYLSERIKGISFENDTNKIILYTDKKRSFLRYSNLWQDINGKRLVQVQEGGDNGIEADYVFTHFSLPHEHEITHGTLYVFGQISDYGFPATHRLNYNNETGLYEADIYLKQGYYNYEYVLLKEDGNAISSFIEGTHYETKNDYTIYIYHRPTGEQYDRLIGVKKLNSKGLF